MRSSSLFRSDSMRPEKRAASRRSFVLFQKELTGKYETKARTPLCAVLQSSYYEVILDS